MSCTRRSWMHGLLGAVSLCAFWQRLAKGQVAAAGPRCSGIVSDAQGMGIVNLVVEVVDPSGGVATDKTKRRGHYDLPAPQSGPYVIVFREPQGSTRLLALRQLTAGTDQMLSVTIDPQTRSFSGAYDALQAVEALCAWVIGDPNNKVAPRLFETIRFNELTDVVELVIRNLDRIKPTDRQREFLSRKADSVRKLLAMVG